MKPTCRSLLLLPAAILCLKAAATLPDSAKQPIQNALAKGGQVAVLFHTDKNAADVASVLAAAIRVNDKNAIRNKQWVTSVTYKGADQKSGCGIVIGTWWTASAGSMAGEWEQLVHAKLKSQVNSMTFQYARNGDFKVLSGTAGSNGDDIMDLCLPG